VSTLPNLLNAFPRDGDGHPVSIMYGLVPGMTDTYTPVKVNADGSLDVEVSIPDSILASQGPAASPTVANAWAMNVVSSVPNLTITSLPSVTLSGSSITQLPEVVTRPVLYAKKITVAGSVTYTGQALPGASQLQPVWQCYKVVTGGGDTILTWADGDTNFDNVAMNLTTLIYV